MINMLVYENEEQAVKKIVAIAKELIAYYSEEQWQLDSVKDIREVIRFFDGHPVLDLACYDVSEQNSIPYLRQLRSKDYANVLLMLIADQRMSPMDYVKPEILASELLLKPYSQEQLKRKVREFIQYFVQSRDSAHNEEIFVIETKDGIRHIPYSQICFFEARQKKIYATTRTAAYPFYQTLDEIETLLPKQYVRCHRSYIVNWDFVERIGLSEATIYLTNGMQVAFSRTYKAVVKSMR